MKKVAINFLLAGKLKDKIQKDADDAEVTISEMIRDIIKQHYYLKNQEATKNDNR